MIRLRPGSSVPWKRPRRSTTQALCCGTMRTPSITNAITTPRSRIQNQYFASTGMNEAATAAPTASASFQNMSPPLDWAILCDPKRIAVGGEHVEGAPRLDPFDPVHPRLPARAAIAHARKPGAGIQPALEARRHAGVDRRHLLCGVPGLVDVHAVAAGRTENRRHEALRGELEPEPGRQRRAERRDAEHQQVEGAGHELDDHQ